ncbi:hypothetical protein HOS16_gp60 [Shigella phage vB_SflS-ISF001]|uniref:Uncharacterized protein n=1 Tax=Shigella phage vB_SflS-ISF001 TaxID=2048005 RepID=A0A2D1GQA0_9CAUD|nr:hypothetical protein HOS16_gp60 [Shigella phage vB_SflS-ISF001]ATN94138.1 hypothetical protein FLXISF001_060 [Shigella phage vB_SflS-ISF001]
MMRIKICMMVSVALAILIESGCGEVTDSCHKTPSQVTTKVMVGFVKLPISSNEITCE